MEGLEVMKDGGLNTRLERQMDRLIASMERVNLEAYLRYVDDRRRQFVVNFMAGLARGLGAAVGFSVLGATVIVILKRLATANLPGIGRWLAEVVKMVMDRI